MSAVKQIVAFTVNVFTEQNGSLYKTLVMTQVTQLWSEAVLSHTDPYETLSPIAAGVDPPELKQKTKLGQKESIVPLTTSHMVVFSCTVQSGCLCEPVCLGAIKHTNKTTLNHLRFVSC